MRLPKRAVYGIVAAVVVAAGAFAVGVVAGQGWAGSGSPPQVRAGSAPANPAPARPRVFVYGDSLVTQSVPYLQAVAGSLGLDVTAARSRAPRRATSSGRSARTSRGRTHPISSSGRSAGTASAPACSATTVSR